MLRIVDKDKGSPISANSSLLVRKLGLMPYFVCILAASYYLYEFILQVAPSVITDELMRDLSIDATQLGIVSAFFYYTYTPMQIPAGLLYDRYGPRVLLTLATAICVVGAFAFGMADSTWQASFGRACMGIGGAFSFIGALVLISRWFPPVYFALMAGLVQFIGSLGSVIGTKPLALSVAAYGWRPSIIGLGFAGIVIAVLIWFFVRDYPKELAHLHTKTNDKSSRFGVEEYSRLKQILIKPQTWAIAIYSLSIWTPILCFAGLWGVPFLKAKYNVNDITAGGMVMFIWIGIAISSPAIGYISNRLEKRNSSLYFAALIGLVCSLVILYGPALNTISLYLVLFGFGVAAAGQSLAFAVINDITERELVGTAIGFNNMATVAGGALFQPLVGKILDWRWDGKILNGIPQYDMSMYQASLVIAPLCFLICCIVSYWFIRETDCEPYFPENGSPNLPKDNAQNNVTNEGLLCTEAD